MVGLTRRELLASASAAALLAVAGCGDGAAPQPPMRKGISLAGDLNRWDDALGVRSHLLGGPHPVTFLNLWVGWPTLQPLAPDPLTRSAAFAQLSDPDGPAAATLDALDVQLARANADRCETSLTVYQAFPAWTHPSVVLDASRDPAAGGRGYPQLGQGTLANDARIPDDHSPQGPWAWLVAYLCARYSGERSPGPGRRGARLGNPHGARLDWLQPMNEPNLTWWPQQSVAAVVAQLARSAAIVASPYRSQGGPGLLIPGTSDVGTPPSPRGTPWDVFSGEVLERLRGWQPDVPVGWAHHNWVDVKYGPRVSGRWRVEDLLDMQRRHAWPQPAVWITEGGYQFSVRRTGADRYVVDHDATADPSQPDALAEQVARLRANWSAMARLPVRAWSQYQVHDRDVRFQSGLRGPVQDTPAGRVLHDPPYPAYALWPTLSV